MSLIWSLTLLIKFKVLFNKLHISQYKTLMYLCNYHIFEQTIIRCINKKWMSRTREILCLCLWTLLVMLWVDNLSQKKDNYATKCYLQMYPKWWILFIFYNRQDWDTSCRSSPGTISCSWTTSSSCNDIYHAAASAQGEGADLKGQGMLSQWLGVNLEIRKYGTDTHKFAFF